MLESMEEKFNHQNPLIIYSITLQLI